MAPAAPWWRRLFGGGGTGARMPWNAAFATVLVATFVAVLWHREPVPDAQLDGEARVGGAAAPAPAQSVPQSPSPAIVAPQAPPAPAAPAAEPPAASARDSSKDAVDSRAADAVRRAPAPSNRQTAPAPEINRKPVESPPPPLPPPAPAAAPAPVVPASPPAPAPAPGIAEPSARAREINESESGGREKRSAYAAGAPAPASVAPPSTADLERSPSAPAAAPAAPAAAAPARRELADSPPALAAQGNADAAASGALRQQAPSRAIAAAKTARPSPDAPAFSALDRWTSFNFTRAGLGGRHARGDIEGLAALVNTVARSATAADAPLAAPVEARLELYRGGAMLAVLEIAGDQVRWTPQPGGTASVGTPPAQTLDALRTLLTR
jgi:hypothetical protein